MRQNVERHLQNKIEDWILLDMRNIYDLRASPYLPLNSKANTRGNDYLLLNFSFHYDLRKHFLLHVLLIFGIACLIQLLVLAL